jgi:hypothetical protein
MRKYLFLGCFLLVCGLVFAQTAPTKDQVSQAAKLLGVSETDLQRWVDSKFVSVPAGIPEVTAEQLYQEYEASQPRADRTYKGKQIKVTGTVAGIGEKSDTNYKKRYALSYKAGSYNFFYAFFDEQDIESIFDVEVGKTVSIIGTLIKADMTGAGPQIYIDHAKIIQ